MSLPARDDVDPEYHFDLTRIYETPDAWDEARDALVERLDDLESRTHQPLESPEDLRVLLAATEECHRRKQRLDLYAALAADVNTGDDAAADRQRRARALEERFEPAVAAVCRRLGATDADRLDRLIADLDGFRRYAERLRERADHVRPPAVEETVAAFEDARTAPTRIIGAVTAEDLDPPAVERPDGETVELGYGNYRTELSRPDRAYRRRVYEAYRGELDRFEGVLTRAFAEKLAAAAAEADVRGFDSIRDRAARGHYPETGAAVRLPGAVHEAMLAGVRANLEPYHRVQIVRRERLSLDELRPWDRHVPITGADPTVEYEAVREHILAALEPLGTDYVERVERFFDERRIDVYPTRDKRTDVPAYCPSSAADGAFVLANFREDVRTAFYVAHELGHALHVEHHRDGPTRYATAPRAVSEVPSILHELLLAEHLLDAGGDLAAAARDRLLECLAGNVYRAAMSSAFVHRLASAVDAGEDVTPERAHDAWSDLQAAFLPEVEYDDRAARNWLGHGRRGVYDHYQYPLGATGALAIRRRLRAGELAPDDYGQFLRSTGREDPVGLFERIGCDVTSPTPYERAAGTFREHVAAVESA
jgi:oligoendopeptidase F